MPSQRGSSDCRWTSAVSCGDAAVCTRLFLWLCWHRSWWKTLSHPPQWRKRGREKHGTLSCQNSHLNRIPFVVSPCCMLMHGCSWSQFVRWLVRVKVSPLSPSVSPSLLSWKSDSSGNKIYIIRNQRFHCFEPFPPSPCVAQLPSTFFRTKTSRMLCQALQ